MNTRDAARGKWRGILMACGVDGKYLTGKHGPCPFCEGRDRWRWDNKDGNGTFFCSQCQAGDGFEVLKRFKGWDFKTAAAEVDKVVNNVRAEPVRKPIDDAKRAELLRSLWAGSAPLNNDMATAYLQSRGALPAQLPVCLRFHPACPVPDGGKLPAMLAMIADKDGNPVNIHRTFLGPNGKADLPEPRATMPGMLPDGCAVRIYPMHGVRLGIAEGIETAIKAAKRFRLPVWAAINSTMLSKWQPPHGVTHVTIFADNDAKFGGQAAGYTLAHRLAARMRIEVDVQIPATTGKDWADDDAA